MADNLIQKIDEVVLFHNRYMVEDDYKIILLPKEIFNEIAISFLPQLESIPEIWVSRCIKSNWAAIQVGGYTYIQSKTLPEKNVWIHLSKICKPIDLFLLKDYLTTTKGVPIDLFVEYGLASAFGSDVLTESEYKQKQEQIEKIRFQIALRLKNG